MVEFIFDEQQTEKFDYLKELEIATQERVAVPNEFENIQENNTESNELKAEFDEQKLQEIATETIQENNSLLYDNSKLAPAIVDGLDTIVSTVFPILHEKTLLTDLQKKQMKLLCLKYDISTKKIETTLSDTELELMSLYKEIEDYKKELPFTPVEKKSLIQPLTEILKDIKFQTSPQNALIIAVVLLLLPRLLPLGINQFIREKKEEPNAVNQAA